MPAAWQCLRRQCTVTQVTMWRATDVCSNLLNTHVLGAECIQQISCTNCDCIVLSANTLANGRLWHEFKRIHSSRGQPAEEICRTRSIWHSDSSNDLQQQD